jgi:GT2 family glycosyltransferase
MTKQIAVLMTCHNRREKTLACLNAFFRAKIPDGFSFKVFLVDDGSTDETSHFVKKQFSSVQIIPGNGDLYWNQGMRLAWKTASQDNRYDFYMWLNDDVIIKRDALDEMLSNYYEILKNENKPVIVTGAFKNGELDDNFSYGGRSIDDKAVVPNGLLQKCTFINGNTVLIPSKIYDIIGNLSNDYTHAIGDFDYGLRAIKEGFSCYTTKAYIGICPVNMGIPSWRDPRVTLVNRLKYLYSPNGLNIREQIIFRRKFYGYKWILFVLKAYSRAMFPKLYENLKKGLA